MNQSIVRIITFAVALIPLPLWAQTPQQWVRSCEALQPVCYVAAGPVVIWVSPSGTSQGRIQLPDVQTVSLVQRNSRYLLSNGPSFALLDIHLHSLRAENTRLTIEFPDGVVQSLPLAGLADALAMVSSSTVSQDAPELDHLAIEQERREAAPAFLIPSTKPQVEFAIRAQGGQSIFGATGR